MNIANSLKQNACVKALTDFDFNCQTLSMISKMGSGSCKTFKRIGNKKNTG